MKKVLKSVLFAAMLIPALAGCNKGPVETRTEEEIIIENCITAVGQVGIAFANLGNADGMTKDIALKDSAIVDGYIYKFDYSLTPVLTYAKDWVYIDSSASGKTLKSVQPGTADLPAENQSFAAYSLKITPTFGGYDSTFVCPNGLTVSETYNNKKYDNLAKDYKIRVNAGVTLELSAAELYTNKELKSGKTRIVTWGIYAGAECDPNSFNASSSKFSLYFDDGASSFVAYDESVQEIPSNLVIGKTYKVSGVYDNYYNTIEIKGYVITEDTTHTCAPAEKITINSDNLADITHASAKCVVTGTLVAIDAGYGNDLKNGWGKNKFNIYFNISGATTSSGALKAECYAYVHQFDTKADYKTWADTGIDLSDTTTFKGAKVTFEGRAYWYSGYPTFYHSVVTSFTPANA